MGLDGVELVMALEEAFGVELKDEEVMQTLTPAPDWASLLTRSATLYAAMPPQTATMISRPARRAVAGLFCGAFKSLVDMKSAPWTSPTRWRVQESHCGLISPLCS